MDTKKYDEKTLSDLRNDVKKRMSEKRYNHTLEVEKMAKSIAELYVPERVDLVRAAALLHDVTKELSVDEQMEICHSHGIEVTDADKRAVKMLHAKTAAAIIPEQYPELADDVLVSAVRWHTTGKANMSIEEKIIYLSDYIDMSRTFADCVKLRELFWSAPIAEMDMRDRMAHLNEVLIVSYDITIASLIEDEKIIDINTIEARNYLICEKLS